MADPGAEWLWPYVEALPRFYARGLSRAFRGGARLIFWYDQAGGLVGGASFDLDGAGVDLAYTFEDVGGFVEGGKGEVRLDGLYRLDQNKYRRFTLICPKCRRYREMLLFFEDKWRCAKCHDVKNLSNSLDQQTNMYQKIEELDKRVGSGRPIGMHHATYAKLEAELKKMKAAWGRRPARTLRPEQQLRVNEHFFKQGEAPHPNEPEPVPFRHPRKRRRKAVKVS